MNLFEILTNPPLNDKLYKDMRLLTSHDNINESLSIDETIKPYREKIENKIIENIKTISNWENYGMLYGSGEFEEILYGVQSKITYDVCVVPIDLISSAERKNKFGASVDIDSTPIIMNLFFPIYETEEKNIFDITPNWFSKNIAHELEHIRWFSILKKDPLSKIDKEKYNYAQKILNNSIIFSNPVKGYRMKKVANCLYNYYKFEQTAFVQGLDEVFSRISKYNSRDYNLIYDRFKETEEYRLLNNMREILASPEEYKDEIKTIFHWSVDKFTKLVEKRYNEYLSMIGRGISYALNDKINTQYHKYKIKIDNISI